MGQEKHFWERIAQRADVSEETFPSQPIAELVGDRRVLIENHLGVTQYSCEKIGVKVKYGCLFVCGQDLMLAHMTKVQLVITGRIDSISLVRRNCT